MSALSTNSKFYYGWRITATNKYIDFNDGSIKVAELKLGSYTANALAAEIKKKMSALSSIVFTVTFNRATRKFTISGTSTFSLLCGSGVNTSQSPFDLLGYTATNKTGAATYTSQNVSGFEYKTQFFLQSYKDPTTNKKAIDGVINKSSSGAIEVIKQGNERFMECEINFITNIIQENGSIVRSNQTGREDFIQFIEYCTEKFEIEFMKNENTPDVFNSYILESTEADSKGLDYDLIETYSQGLPYYYKSGKLKFKLIS